MIKEVTPKMTPDTLRATLRFLKKFNDMHTKRAHGYEDANGSKYVGTVENFGDEILLESRKLLMDKPSLKRLFTVNTFSKYFDIDFSDLTDTYSQQNMLVALLKKDVLTHNRTYSILYEDCEYETVIRSESYGQYRDERPAINDSKVIRDVFYTTLNPPILIIKNMDDEEVDRITLQLEIDEWTTTTYMVHYDISTRDMINDYTKPVKKENGKYDVTMEFDSSCNGLPFSWITIDLFITDPPIELSYTNIDDDVNPAELSIGTDGQGITHAYPYMNAECMGEDEDIHDWIIKAYSAGDIFSPNNLESNVTAGLRRIQFLKTPDIRVAPTKAIDVLFNMENCKFMIAGEGWSIRKAEQGYWDYDSTTFDNPYFAYIPLATFIKNAEEDTKDFKYAFHIAFSDVYIPYQGDKGNAVSGIHVDSGSDYANHSIMKRHGIIHSLEQFGGLPTYFNYLLKRDIHRSHVELYAIRDRLDRINQRVYEKQTAALILDSAVPQSELKFLIDETPISICYDLETRRYVTKVEPPSIQNALSEITYIDPYNLGNKEIEGQDKLQKFIYHGNRTFSLGSMEFDPELERARVYCISNDPMEYVNNGSVNGLYHRSERTMARICDIPTEYKQLMHIKNIAPTILFDNKYVRSEVGFSNDEKKAIWNEKYSRWVRSTEGDDVPHNKRRWIFKDYENQDSLIGYPFLKSEYPLYGRLNTKTFLSELAITVGNGGTGYDIDDTFHFTIGGLPIDGKVTNITSSGTVISIEITSEDVAIVTSNFGSEISTYETTVVASENGKGLIVKIEFEDDLWETKQPYQLDEVPTDLYSYRFDYFGNIWIWTYNDEDHKWYKSVQFTGTPIHDNYYDETNRVKQEDRKINDVLIFNLLNSNPYILEDYANDPYSYTETFDFNILYDTGFNRDIDISDKLKLRNIAGAVYTVRPDPESITRGIVTYYDANTPFSESGVTNPILLPDHHPKNLVEYYNKTNKFMLSEHGVWIYSPTRDKKHIVANDTTFTVDANSKMIRRESYITLNDPISYNQSEQVILSDGTSVSNIYIYDEYKIPKEYESIEMLAKVTDIDTIREMIEEKSPEAEVLTYDYVDNSVLRSYFMQSEFMYGNGSFKNTEISKSRDNGEKIVNKVSGGSTVPIGKQQAGGYVDIANEEYNIDVSIDGSSNYGIPITFFQIDDPEFILEFIPDNFRVYDDYDNDISSTSIIILGKTKFIFRDGSWKKLN